ncbi:chaperone protein dnaJ 20, chloroplastic [Morus notabilis]|nr:chaperone protein dnaJ 20, chloroplastic [Morus notabilis]
MNPNITQFVDRRQIPYKITGTTISCRSSTSGHNQLQMDNYTKKANFYEVLSLSTKIVGLEDIKKAYRSMALQYHPDVCLDPSAKAESTRRFIEVQKAYETLSNPVSRKMYDYELGLADYNSLGFGMEGKTSVFSKEVWENQLHELRRRSQSRMMKRRK